MPSDTVFSFEELLMSYPTTMDKIIKNIPLHLRFDVGAINKDFYHLICSMDKEKYKLKIKGLPNQQYFCEPFRFDDIVSSVLTSNRQDFNELHLEDLILNTHNLKQLIKLAEKHGNSIKTLKMESCVLKDLQLFGQLLEKLSSLENWIVEYCEIERWQQGKLLNIQPALKGLQNFTLCDSEVELAHFIASDTIESFDNRQQELGFSEPLFWNFVQSQSKLRRLKITFEEPFYLNHDESHAKYFKRMENLEELQFCTLGTDGLFRELARDHPMLKFFYLDVSCEDNHTVSTIFNHASQLESLSIRFNNENCIQFLQLPRLKNLKEIHLSFINPWLPEDGFTQWDVMMDLSKLYMPNIKVLKMYGSLCEGKEFEINDALENFSRHWENIEVLEFWYLNDFKTLDADRILQNFGKLKSLRLHNFTKDESDKKYPQIEELDLYGSAEQELNLIKALPNLRKLTIKNLHGQYSKDSMQLGLFESIASLDKLNELDMDNNWDEIPNEARECVHIVKKLCRKVAKFKMTMSSEKFSSELFALIGTDNDCKTFTNEKSKHSICLTNHRY